MRTAAILVALLAGCSETIVLGSECPNSRGLCEPRPASGDPEGSVEADGAQPNELPEAGSDSGGMLDGGMAPEVPDAGLDAELLDARLPDDADTDAGNDAYVETRTLPFANPSFELVGGRSAGDLVVTENPSQIAPWYACRINMKVNTTVDDGGKVVSPTDGATFAGDTAFTGTNYTGLAQDLSEPLMTERPYAFLIDLYATKPLPSLTNPRLTVAAGLIQAGPGTCAIPNVQLASSAPITPGRWQTECIKFTVPRGVTVNMVSLYVDTPADFVNFGPTLYMDNIRLDPSCR